MTPTDLSLFDLPDQEALRERLKTLAGELGLKAGRGGVTISDVRIAAQNAGWMTGQESKALLSKLRLPTLLVDAGLIAAPGCYRRSNVGRAHGNLNQVYVAREWSEAVA